MADVNGDDRADVIIANRLSQNLAIFLGNGDGTFRNPITYPLRPTDIGYSLVLADFNNDGKLDIAVADLRSTKIDVFLGNGDGTFNSPITSSRAIAPPLSMAVGDLDSDGNMDILVGGNGSTWILFGNGDGTFQPSRYVSGSLGGVAIGDFNGDGHLDLAIANVSPAGTENVGISLGNGDGTFQPPRVFSVQLNQPTEIALGDFNDDGKLDLAVTDYRSNGVSVFLGNGDGTLGTAKLAYAGVGPGAITTADFDGDGKLDLAVADFNGGGITALKGVGDGTFPTFTSFATGNGPDWIAAGYLNQDGSPDLVVSNLYSNSFSVLLNQATFADFDLSSPIPASIVLTPGQTSTTTTVRVLSLGAFQFPVTLTCSGLPAGSTCSFSPSNTVTPSPGSPAIVTLSVQSSSTRPDVSFAFTVAATSPNSPAPPKTRTVTALIRDFRIEQTIGGFDTSLVAFPGQPAVFTMFLKSIAGYNDQVTFSCQSGSTPPPQTCTPSPTTVTPAASFTISASDNTVRDYSFQVRGVGNDPLAVTHTRNLSLHVVDYAFGTPTVGSATILPGALVTSQVPVMSVGSFFGTVHLSCGAMVSGIHCSTNSEARPYPGVPSRAFLTITTDIALPGGLYTVTLQGTADGDPRGPKTVNIQLHVQDYTVSLTPDSPQIFPGQTKDFSGLLTSIENFNYLVDLSCAPGATNPPSTCNITPTSTTPSAPGTFTLTAGSNAIQDFSFAVSAQMHNGSTLHLQPVRLRVVDVNLGALAPATISVGAGNLSQPVTFRLTPLGSFNAPVTLNCAGLPSGSVCKFNGVTAPVTVTVSGSPLYETLVITTGSSDIPNLYTVSVTATTPNRPVPTQSQPLALNLLATSGSTDAGIAITGPPAQSAIPVGAAITFSAAVSNNGTGVVNANAYFTFPEPTLVQSAVITGGNTCTGSGTITLSLNCSIGAMNSSDLKTIDVVMRPGLKRSITLNGFVNTELSDTDLSNNQATVVRQIRLRPFARSGQGLLLP